MMKVLTLVNILMAAKDTGNSESLIIGPKTFMQSSGRRDLATVPAASSA